MGELIEVENGDKTVLEIEISCSKWGRSRAFLFFGRAGQGCLLFFWFVLNVFPLSSKVVSSGSQRVPQVPSVFPNMFPIAFHFLSRIIWPCFNSHVSKLFGGGGVGRGKSQGMTKHASMLGSAPCSQNIGGGPIKLFSLGWGVHYGCTLSPIYRSMNKFPLL
jgi:hypothetical protein